MSKKSVIIILICLMLCGTLIFGVISLKKSQSQAYPESGSASEIQELNQLEAKKDQINRKLKALKLSAEREKIGKGTVSFVCVGAHKKVYNVVFPELKKREYPGVLVLTEEFFVGNPDCITAEQFSELRNAVWEVAAGFSATAEDPIEALKELLERIKELGVDTVSTVYFARNKYSSLYDNDLMALGIKNIAFHGEGMDSLDDGLNPTLPTESSLWYVYSREYSFSGKNTVLSSIEDSGGNLIFEITFDTSQLTSYCTDYGIKNLLTICIGRDKEKIDFLTLDDARNYVLSVYNGEDSVDDKYQTELKTLETELKNIQKMIDELYKKVSQ